MLTDSSFNRLRTSIFFVIVTEIKKNMRKVIGNNQGSEGNAIVEDSPLFRLNDDCLRQIFSYLPIPERIRIQRVCKNWQRVGKLPWTDIKRFYTDNDRNPLLDKKDPILYTVPILKQVLNLCGSSIIHFEYSLSVIQYNTILNCTVTKLLKILKKFCPNIRSIRIFGKSFNSTALEFLRKNFSELTDIRFGGITKGHEDLVANYFAVNKRLKSIEISGFYNSITGSCLLNLNANTIESIAISGCKKLLLVNLEKVLPNFTKLQTLSIKENQKITKYSDKILNLIPEKSNLKNLAIREYNDISHFRKEISNGKCLQHFVNLTSLDFRGDRMLNDNVLKVVGEYCKKLTHVILDCSQCVKDKGLINITNLPELEYLELNLLYMILGKSLNHMPKLKTLKCTNCVKIEARVFHSLLLHSKNLEYLQVLNCCKVDPDTLISSAIKGTNYRTNDVKLNLYVSRKKGVRKDIHFSRRLRIVEDSDDFIYPSSESDESLSV